MSTTPIDQQPPPMAVTHQAYTTHSGHGSVGPVIGVLAVITILGVIAGMIGRLCSGRPIMGHAQYDFEGWVEKKCSTCLDGRVDYPPPPPPRTFYGDEVPVAMPAETPQEIKEEEDQPPQQQQQEQKQQQHQHQHQQQQQHQHQHQQRRHQHNNKSHATTSDQS